MHWVIQNNLHNEAGHVLLMSALERYNLPHTVVKVIPFVHELQEDINPPNPVIAMGAHTLSLISEAKGWNPGIYINDNFDYETYIKEWGKYMLNYESQICTWSDIDKSVTKDNDVFIRPCNDGKVFAGEITTSEKIKEWKKKIEDMRIVFSLGKTEAIPEDTKILISPLKKIYNEYRFYVVNGKPITGSLYKEGTRIYSKVCIDECVFRFVQRMIDIWQPDKAFVMDVADTPNGYKIIEINSLNSSGFYACEMDKVVIALEEMNEHTN